LSIFSFTTFTKQAQRKKHISRYKIGKRKTRNRRFLIVCEGQTEEKYFKSFKVNGIRVQVIDLKGKSKMELVDYTSRTISYSKKDSFDEVWCVFDMDRNLQNPSPQEATNFDNAIQKAIKQGYHVAYSNDSFELWFYLHYEDIYKSCNRTFYYKTLAKKWNLNNYEEQAKQVKFCIQLYELLQNDENASQELAIKRAKKLFEKQKHLKYHQQNPVTMVYKLVLLLNENLRR